MMSAQDPEMGSGAAHVQKFHFWASHFSSLSPFPIFQMTEHGFSVSQSEVFQPLASESLGMLVKKHTFLTPQGSSESESLRHGTQKTVFEEAPEMIRLFGYTQKFDTHWNKYLK